MQKLNKNYVIFLLLGLISVGMVLVILFVSNISIPKFKEYTGTSYVANLQSGFDFRNLPRAQEGYFQYFASSESIIYAPISSVGISSISMYANNLLPDNSIEICLSDINLVKLVCRDFITDNMPNITWEEKFSLPIYSKSEKYICTALINSKDQLDPIRDVQIGCNLKAAYSGKNSEVISTYPENKYKIGPNILDDSKLFRLDFEKLIEVRYSISPELASGEQIFADICVNIILPVGLSEKRCADSISINEGNQNQINSNSLSLNLDIPENSRISFSCRTQTDRLASCSMFAIVSNE